MIAPDTILQITAIVTAAVTLIVGTGWAAVSTLIRRADRSGGAR